MQIAPWLLVTTALTAPAAPSQDRPALSISSAAIAAAATQQPPQRPTGVAGGAPQDPAHQFGLGANITMSNYGAGVSMRYFLGQHIGVSLQAAWYRSPYRVSSAGRTTTENSTAVQALPSVMYMFGQADAKKVATLRPYLGTGAHYIHANGLRTFPGSASTNLNGVGMEVYGGAELSFLDYPDLTISNELMYLRVPENFGTAFARWNYAVAVHFYLK